MPITVKEVMELPILDTAKVLAGKENLAGRRVEWMSAIEGPVENFVRKDEFILTTGMGCEAAADLFHFVQDVFASGASALAIALGRYVEYIPEKIITFAENNNFILIELPWKLRFSDIQRETTKEINKRQNSFLEQARKMQKRLIDFIAQGKDLSDLLKYVEQKMNCTIVFADSKGRMKSSGIDPMEIFSLWDDLVETESIIENELEHRHIQKINFEAGYLLKKEITTSSKSLAQGHFVILMPTNEFLTNAMLQTLESLTAATALWISREDAIAKTEIRLRNEFIWGLAKTAEMILDEKVQSRAKLFGFNLDLPYICLVGYSESFDIHASEEEEQALGFKNVIYYIEEEVRYAGSVVGRKVAFTFDDDYLIVFLESKSDEQMIVHQFLDLVDKKLKGLLPGVVFSWGIGKHLDGVKQFHESYKKAFSALDMTLSQQEPGQRLSFEDTRLNRLLLHFASNDEVKNITLSAIAPLIEYEEKRGMDLIETFIAYDNQNGNVSQAARVLNLHRQSLLYRLKKIESLTDLSLDNPDDIFLLNISIKVWLTGALTNEN